MSPLTQGLNYSSACDGLKFGHLTDIRILMEGVKVSVVTFYSLAIVTLSVVCASFYCTLFACSARN